MKNPQRIRDMITRERDYSYEHEIERSKRWRNMDRGEQLRSRAAGAATAPSAPGHSEGESNEQR